MEDLKERYYHICAKLANVRAVPGTDLKISVFDAGHERRRKEQLERSLCRDPVSRSAPSPRDSPSPETLTTASILHAPAPLLPPP